MIVLIMGVATAFSVDLVRRFNHPSGVVFHLAIVVVLAVIVGHRTVTHIILGGMQIAIVPVEVQPFCEESTHNLIE